MLRSREEAWMRAEEARGRPERGEKGSEGGRKLICFHGSAMSGRIFGQQIEDLVRETGMREVQVEGSLPVEEIRNRVEMAQREAYGFDEPLFSHSLDAGTLLRDAEEEAGGLLAEEDALVGFSRGATAAMLVASKLLEEGMPCPGRLVLICAASVPDEVRLSGLALPPVAVFGEEDRVIDEGEVLSRLRCAVDEKGGGEVVVLRHGEGHAPLPHAPEQRAALRKEIASLIKEI